MNTTIIDKILIHMLDHEHNEVIYSLSKSTNVQIDVCTNIDERTIKRNGSDYKQ